MTKEKQAALMRAKALALAAQNITHNIDAGDFRALGQTLLGAERTLLDLREYQASKFDPPHFNMVSLGVDDDADERGSEG
jgi:fermentation-respiration switch protein FrsA (DUF1100 family)